MAGNAEPLFSTADVDEMRQLSESSLPDFATIERPSTAVGAGGTVRREPYATVAVDVPCRISSLAVTEQERVGTMAPNASWTIVFPIGTDVRIGDRLRCTVTQRKGTAIMAVAQLGKDLHVVGPLAPVTWGAVCRVFASDLPPTEKP